MHIVCPHCTTSYAIKLASLGVNGRTVRCSRCRETWVARPEDALEEVEAPVLAAASGTQDHSDRAERWNSEESHSAPDTPVVESPSIVGDWPTGIVESGNNSPEGVVDGGDSKKRPFWLARLFRRKSADARPRRSSALGLSVACAGMGALVIALVVWRGEMVRLLPQTAAFYKLVGLEVNLRGLAFRDVKVTSETVEGKQVLVIEGVIVGETKKPADIPRLRFSVRDAQGAEIYAWNTVLEQTVLQPGERAFFKSRLASPPPEGRNIDVRFFTRRDIAGGSA